MTLILGRLYNLPPATIAKFRTNLRTIRGVIRSRLGNKPPSFPRRVLQRFRSTENSFAFSIKTYLLVTAEKIDKAIGLPPSQE